MSKGPSSQTVNQTNEPPGYVSSAQQDLLSAANRITSPFLQNAPGSTVAGFSPDQMMGFDLARGMAQNAFTAPHITVPMNSPIQGGNFMYPASASVTPAQLGDPSLVVTENVGRGAMADAASAGPAAQSHAAQINPNAGVIGSGDVSQWLNPYSNAVLDPTIAAMRRELDKTQAQIGARNASSAAFGGSRGALQSSEANRAFGDQVALTSGTVMRDAYNNALNTALANGRTSQGNAQFNAGAEQATNLSNAAAQNNMGQFNANLQQNTNLANAGALNDMSKVNSNLALAASAANAAAQNRNNEMNAGYTQAANTSNAGAINDLNRIFSSQYNTLANADADRSLTAAGLQNTFANSEQQRQLSALQALLGVGGQQQQVAQQSLNQPLDMLRLLGSQTPGAYGSSSSSTQPTQSNPIGAAAGLVGVGNGLFGSSGLFPGALGGGAAAAASAAPAGLFASGAEIAPFLFSDERAKTDITKLGKDPQTGLDMYAYRYKDDPKSYPKVVGPMAQQIEKQYPGSVREIGGRKIVEGGPLRALFGMPA